MERLRGPNLEIALSLNEGHDFGFLGSSFKIVASLDNNGIETNVFNGEQLVKFNSELIWASDKINIKKMKNFKCPIRLEFFRVESKKPFGYVILSLKTAQYWAEGDCVVLKEETVKVCGLGKEAKGSCPQVVLSLRIQDTQGNDETLSARPDGTEVQWEVPSKTSESSIALRIPKIQLEYQQDKNGPSSPRLLDSQGISPEDNKKSSGGDAGLKLQAYHSFILEVDLIDVKWLSNLKDIHFRFHHAKAEVEWAAHEEIRETVPHTVVNCKNVTARFRFLISPLELEPLLAAVRPTLTVCTTRQGRPQVLALAHLPVPTLDQRELHSSAAINSLGPMEPVGTVSFTTRLSDQGPQTYQQLSVVDGDGVLADRIKDDLETWKEKERQRFEQDFNERLEAEISQIQSEWALREQELEQEANEKMDLCRTLSDEMQKVMHNVKEKEKALERAKTDLEVGYRKLVADTKRETSQLREELMARLEAKDQVIVKLQEEIASLNFQLEAQRNKPGSLTKEQTETLLVDTKKLLEKLDSANHSKAFFKEQWSRAVRELHRIKSDGWKDIQVQLQCRKDELEQLGLGQLMQPVSQHDRNAINNKTENRPHDKLHRLMQGTGELQIDNRDTHVPDESS